MSPRDASDDTAELRSRPLPPAVHHEERETDRTTAMRIAPPSPEWVDARVRHVPLPPAETADLGLVTASPGRGGSGRGGGRNRRRRVVPVLVAAGAALAVTVVILGSRWDGGDDRALPDKVSATRDAIAPTGAAASPSASPSPARSASASASVSPSASPSATLTRPAPRAPAPPPTRATGRVDPTPPPATAGPGVLRVGDRGPAVVELQQRLNQVMDPDLAVNGVYDSRVRKYVAFYQSHFGIRSDESGVYGADTRRHLEARTQEP